MKHFSQGLRLVSMVFAIVALGACSSFSAHETDADDSQYLHENNLNQAELTEHKAWQYEQSGAESVSYLNDLLSVNQLEPLIVLALENNPSLNQMHVALKLAYAQRNVTAANHWFSVDANFDAQKSKNESTEYTTSLGVSWELDVWQKIANNVSAQDMNIASSQADYQSSKDALVASVMRAYLNIILQHNLLDIEEQRLLVLENNEQSIIERYQWGLGDLEALDTARSDTASTRATIAEYKENIAQAQRTLVLLTGVDSVDNLPTTAEFPEVIQALNSLPTQDLARRPDLQSAYYTIQSKHYLVDVAYKDLLPSISLSASLSDVANTPSQSLLTSPVWTLLGNLSAPLFQGGALRAQVDIAELNAEQAFWEYQDTLLTAVNEVENALGQEQSLLKQKLQIQLAVASAERSFSNYQSKYQQGLVDILDLLSIQQQVYDLQAQLSQLNYTILTNRIDLGLALGLGVAS